MSEDAIVTLKGAKDTYFVRRKNISWWRANHTAKGDPQLEVRAWDGRPSPYLTFVGVDAVNVLDALLDAFGQRMASQGAPWFWSDEVGEAYVLTESGNPVWGLRDDEEETP